MFPPPRLFGESHRRAPPGRLDGGGETAGTGTDDQEVCLFHGPFPASPAMSAAR